MFRTPMPDWGFRQSVVMLYLLVANLAYIEQGLVDIIHAMVHAMMSADLAARLGGSGDDYDCLYKLMLLGGTCSGKTAVLLRLCNDLYIEHSYANAGLEFNVKRIAVDDTVVKLQVWDTAGNDLFALPHTTAFLRGAVGFLVMYSITQADTFRQVPKYLTRIRDHASRGVEIMLLGTCCDDEEG